MKRNQDKSLVTLNAILFAGVLVARLTDFGYSLTVGERFEFGLVLSEQTENLSIVLLLAYLLFWIYQAFFTKKRNTPIDILRVVFVEFCVLLGALSTNLPTFLLFSGLATVLTIEFLPKDPVRKPIRKAVMEIGEILFFAAAIIFIREKGLQPLSSWENLSFPDAGLWLIATALIFRIASVIGLVTDEREGPHGLNTLLLVFTPLFWVSPFRYEGGPALVVSGLGFLMLLFLLLRGLALPDERSTIYLATTALALLMLREFLSPMTLLILIGAAGIILFSLGLLGEKKESVRDFLDQKILSITENQLNFISLTDNIESRMKGRKMAKARAFLAPTNLLNRMTLSVPLSGGRGLSLIMSKLAVGRVQYYLAISTLLWCLVWICFLLASLLPCAAALTLRWIPMKRLTHRRLAASFVVLSVLGPFLFLFFSGTMSDPVLFHAFTLFGPQLLETALHFKFELISGDISLALAVLGAWFIFVWSCPDENSLFMSLLILTVLLLTVMSHDLFSFFFLDFVAGMLLLFGSRERLVHFVTWTLGSIFLFALMAQLLPSLAQGQSDLILIPVGSHPLYSALFLLYVLVRLPLIPFQLRARDFVSKAFETITRVVLVSIFVSHLGLALWNAFPEFFRHEVFISILAVIAIQTTLFLMTKKDAPFPLSIVVCPVFLALVSGGEWGDMGAAIYIENLILCLSLLSFQSSGEGLSDTWVPRLTIRSLCAFPGTPGFIALLLVASSVYAESKPYGVCLLVAVLSASLKLQEADLLVPRSALMVED